MNALKEARESEPGEAMPSEASKQFEEMVLSHLGMLYPMARKLCANAHDAEDLVQETVLRAQRSFGNFDCREYGARPWLLKIMRNAFSADRRHQRKGPSLLSDMSFDQFAAEIEKEEFPLLENHEIDWEDFDEELKAAVESLAPDYRIVVLMWSFGGLTYKQMADVLDCAPGTVMSRLYRARQLLAESLANYVREQGIRPRFDLT